MSEKVLAAFKLKERVRTGWALRGVEAPESVADHSWGTALLCLLYADEAGLRAETAVNMAIVHDIAEAITGDVPTRVAEMNDRDLRRRKREREVTAMDQMFPHAVDATVRELWDEYEESQSPTALFVRDMNLVDMCLQALIYERDRRYPTDAANPNFPDFKGLDEFFATSRPRFSTQVGKRLFDEIFREYAALPSVRKRGGAHV
jgi:putative hydrolase of HD superfamily